MKTESSNHQQNEISFHASRRGAGMTIKGDNPVGMLYDFIPGAIFLMGIGAGLYVWAYNRTHNSSNTAKQDATSPKLPPATVITGAQIKEEAKNLRQSSFLIGNVIQSNSTNYLFAPEKIGKSTLAMQFACAIANGIQPSCFPPLQEIHPAQTVFYYDTELGVNQHNQRFGANPLYDKVRVIFKSQWLSVESLLNDIEQKVLADPYDCTIIVDNLSSIGGLLSDDNARLVTNRILSIRTAVEAQNREFTVIFVSHTLKDTDESKPITPKDIRGSQLLTGFADMTLALEPTNMGNDYVMLKVCDSRSTEKPEQVYVMKRCCNRGNFHFDFVEMGNEEDLLSQKKSPKSQKAILSSTELIEAVQAKEPKKNYKAWQQDRDKGMSTRKIASKYGVTATSVVKHTVNNKRGIPKHSTGVA